MGNIFRDSKDAVGIDAAQIGPDQHVGPQLCIARFDTGGGKDVLGEPQQRALGIEDPVLAHNIM